MRPIDVARKLRVSTTTLRHYEEWGLCPPVPRAPNGYRVYSDLHVAYFECIRAMATGFGMDVTAAVLRHIVRGEMDEGLWLATERQAQLFEEKRSAEKTLRLLDQAGPDVPGKHARRRALTIGAVVKETGIVASTIRYWELEGLISVRRDEENGYRLFSAADVRKLLLIRALRSAIYSLATIRDVMREVDANNLDAARRVARDALHHLNKRNRLQLQGMHYLYRLCAAVAAATSSCGTAGLPIPR